MQHVQWIFSGIGTEIISAIAGLLIGAAGGGVIGYRKGVKKIEMVQNAGDNSTQNQIGSVNINDK